MTEPLVFDHTALVALFDAHPDVYRAWEQTWVNAALGVFPSAAVAEANHVVGATDEAWWAILGPACGTLVPLDRHAAVESHNLPGELVVRHIIHTARAVDGTVVTLEPKQYPPGLPVRAL
jgi:hypothetical protein